ncbi:MAG: 3'(2'),5'-bisphosphate nucleotidase CysQ [Alphaproteobacteria bacterium]|nr:3'(2'),5'-bisphosphate nucleotidase CysQ [Alphaproteobacteria bacterium]
MAPKVLSADLIADLAVLRGAVREAGALARDFFAGEVKSWNKGPDNPVSEADYAVDALLKERLRGHRPDYGWLSEETEDNAERLGIRRVWIIDPIDGTRAFLRKEPEFAVVAALVENGRPLLGAVYNPAKEEFFEAALGEGATLNQKPIRVSDRAGVVGARMLSSRRTFERHNWMEAATGAEFRFVNSMAYRVALVAAGRFDATVTLTRKSDWDIAAADLIVGEAGGRMTWLDGRVITYNRQTIEHPNIVAAGPALHAALLEGLAQPPSGT